MSQEVDPVFNALFSKLNKEELDLLERALKIRVEQPTLDGIDIAAIKASREQYFFETAMEVATANMADRPMCGWQFPKSYHCLICGTEFDVLGFDVKMCPVCGGPSFKPVEFLEGRYVNTIIGSMVQAYPHVIPVLDVLKLTPIQTIWTRHESKASEANNWHSHDTWLIPAKSDDEIQHLIGIVLRAPEILKVYRIKNNDPTLWEDDSHEFPLEPIVTEIEKIKKAIKKAQRAAKKAAKEAAMGAHEEELKIPLPKISYHRNIPGWKFKTVCGQSPEESYATKDDASGERANYCRTCDDHEEPNCHRTSIQREEGTIKVEDLDGPGMWFWTWETTCGADTYRCYMNVEEATTALVDHCEACTERKEGCWKPQDTNTPLPANTAPEPQAESLPNEATTAQEVTEAVEAEPVVTSETASEASIVPIKTSEAFTIPKVAPAEPTKSSRTKMNPELEAEISEMMAERNRLKREGLKPAPTWEVMETTTGVPKQTLFSRAKKMGLV